MPASPSAISRADGFSPCDALSWTTPSHVAPASDGVERRWARLERKNSAAVAHATTAHNEAYVTAGELASRRAGRTSRCNPATTEGDPSGSGSADRRERCTWRRDETRQAASTPKRT